MIIILMGTSSSGKSSLAQALKERLGENWLLFNTDNYLGMLGEKYTLGLQMGSSLQTTQNNIAYALKHADHTFEVVTGFLCHKLYATIPFVIKKLISSEFHVVYDSLITKADEVEALRQEFSNETLLFIYLEAKANIIKEREAKRRDRLIGSALHWLKQMDCKKNADLIFKTDTLSITEITDCIFATLPTAYY